MLNTDVVIIGAGSAGLSALRQVKKHTNNYIIIDQSPLGTKCARTGCMPSKALIQVAKQYHHHRVLYEAGIKSFGISDIKISEVLEYTRNLRDHFANEMSKTTKHLAGDHLIIGKAKIIAPDRIQVDDLEIQTKKIIIATGSNPKTLPSWEDFNNLILTSDTIFEQSDLPKRIAVVGMGPIGLELGQALNRLGIKITGFTRKKTLTLTHNPYINSKAFDIFTNEFPIITNADIDIKSNGNILKINTFDKEYEFDAILAAIGVSPQLEGLGLENLDIDIKDKKQIRFDPQTMQIKNMPIFIAGDANGCKSILHEALDEGFIAGQNSISDSIKSYCRRASLKLVFSDPQIAEVGYNYETLKEKNIPFITGEIDFKNQSRSILENNNQGLMHIYVNPDSAEILGAELICPNAEHLASQFAMAIQNKLTIYDLLASPFYHPTTEEAIRTIIQDIVKQLSQKDIDHLPLCESGPESPLC